MGIKYPTIQWTDGADKVEGWHGNYLFTIYQPDPHKDEWRASHHSHPISNKHGIYTFVSIKSAKESCNATLRSLIEDKVSRAQSVLAMYTSDSEDDYILFGAKCSDMFNSEFQGVEYDGYVKLIGSGDYVDIEVHAETGKIKDWEPITLDDYKNAVGKGSD